MPIQVGRANGKGAICAEELVKLQTERLKELSKKFKGSSITGTHSIILSGTVKTDLQSLENVIEE